MGGLHVVIHLHDDEFMRQRDFYNPILHDPRITIVGAGGIGSWVTVALSKLGVRHLRVIDPDKVEPHNLSTTPYREQDIGVKKVHALRAILDEMGRGMIPVVAWYKGAKLPRTDILISAVDSMAARRLLFKIAQEQKIPFYIDGRIGGENLRVYAIQPGQPKDRKLYRTTLVPDYRVAPLPCTGQQVMDVGLTIAGLITRAVRQWVAARQYNPEVIVKQDVLVMLVAEPIILKLERS